MRGVPKAIATKQDYLNLIAEGYDIREQLKALLNTAKMMVDVLEYPEGYGTPEYDGPELEPIWEERTNDRGKIFRIGFTVEEVRGLLAEQELIIAGR